MSQSGKNDVPQNTLRLDQVTEGEDTESSTLTHISQQTMTTTTQDTPTEVEHSEGQGEPVPPDESEFSISIPESQKVELPQFPHFHASNCYFLLPCICRC